MPGGFTFAWLHSYRNADREVSMRNQIEKASGVRPTVMVGLCHGLSFIISVHPKDKARVTLVPPHGMQILDEAAEEFFLRCNMTPVQEMPTGFGVPGSRNWEVIPRGYVQ